MARRQRGCNDLEPSDAEVREAVHTLAHEGSPMKHVPSAPFFRDHSVGPRGGRSRLVAVGSALVVGASIMAALGVPASAQAATPSCEGEPATIVGTSGPDTLVGTPGRDVIVALEGDDVIDGGGGSYDVICGGAGGDRITNTSGWIYGGTGDDRISTGEGNDFAYGEPGADVISTHAGVDFLSGGDGNDVLRGGPDADTMTKVHGPGWRPDDGRGRGDDRMFGGAGRDGVQYAAAYPVRVDLSTGRADDGTGGHDVLAGIEDVEGGTGADHITGNGADNVLEGLGGNDVIDARGGNDTVYVQPRWRAHLIGGPGTDWINVEVEERDGTGVFVDLARGITHVFNGSKRISTLRGFENIEGSSGADVLRGDDRRNVIWGSNQGDKILGLGGHDRLYGFGPRSSTNPGDRADGGRGRDLCSARQTVRCEMPDPFVP